MLAVTAPAVLLAGLEKTVHFVGAASDPAFTIAAAVFITEAFTRRGGGAARHGARLLLLPTAVCDAVLEPSCCRGGALINLALSMRAMSFATTTSISASFAALNVAHFRAATAMSDTQSSYVSSSRASIYLAPPMRTMPSATTTSFGKRLAALNVAHFRAHAATAMSNTQSS